MKRLLRIIRGWTADNWRTIALVLLTGLALGTLLMNRLGSLVGGLSADEYALQQQLASNEITLQSVLRDPLFLPHDIALFLLELTPFSGPTAIRGISVLFGLLGLAGFFYVLHKWYTPRIAVLGTILFATSGWFLFTSRYASPESSYLLLPLLIAGAVALHAKARSKLGLLAVVLFGISALYIPGVIWFLLPAIWLLRKPFLKSFALNPVWLTTIAIMLSAALVVPLGIMLTNPLPGASALGNIAHLLGLPSDLPNPGAVVNTLQDSLTQIFVLHNAGPIAAVGNLPWLDVCTSVLVLLGGIQFARHNRLNRSKLIGIIVLFSLLLIGLSGPASILLLLPFVYLTAVEGLKWLLGIWLDVFPRNPFARGFGIVCITLLVVGIGFYHVNRYYVAWSSVPETRELYNKVP